MERRNRWAMVALIIAGLAGSLLAYDWGWPADPRQLTTTPDNSLLPTYGCGFANMTSRMHVVFADKQGTTRIVYYIRSSDHGVTWQSPVMIDERSGNYTFSIAADSMGNVHFVNRHFSDNGLYYRRSVDTGATWQAATQIATQTDNIVLLTNHSQNVYIVNVIPGEPSYAELYKSTSGGADWVGPISIGSARAYGGLRGCITESGTINLFYAWGIQSGDAKVYQVRSTDDGESWSPEVQVPGVPQNSSSEGAWSSGNTVFLATSTFGNPANFRRSTNGGVAWQSAQTLAFMAKSVVWTSDGTAHVVCIRNDTAVVWMKSTNGGASWTAPRSISGSESGTRSTPYIGTDDEFKLNAIWGSLESGNGEIFTAYGDTTLGIAEPGAGARVLPRLSVTPNPARGIVRLAGVSGAEVFDRDGRTVADLAEGANDVSRLEAGVYFVRSGNAVTRFVKLR